MTCGLNHTLYEAHEHMRRLHESSAFESQGLAVIIDHSRVQAFRYRHHYLDAGRLHIAFDGVVDDGPAGEVVFSCDEDVERIVAGAVTFYREARLVTVVGVQSAGTVFNGG